MIAPGVGRRSAKPPRKTLSKTFAAALEVWLGVGISARMRYRTNDLIDQNLRSSRDLATRGLEELQQKCHDVLMRLDLRAMSDAMQQLIARLRQCLEDLARAAVGTMRSRSPQTSSTGTRTSARRNGFSSSGSTRRP